MKKRTVASLALTGLFLAIFLFAWRQAVLARRAEGALDSLSRKHAALLDDLRRRQDLLAAGARRLSEMGARLSALKATSVPSTARALALKFLALSAQPWREIALATDPKLQALYMANERTSIPVRYGPFIRAQNLTPEQSARFSEAQLAADQRTLDIKAAAVAQGLPLDDPGIASLLKQSGQELQQAQTDLLGPDGYQQLTQYDRALPIRSFVDTLGGALAFTDAPLTAQQADQLVQQLAGASSSYNEGGVAIPPRMTYAYQSLMASQSLAPDPIDWDEVKPQAQASLSPSQFDLLNDAMQESLSTAHLFNLMMEQSKDSPMVGFVYSRKTD
jgi:hypothetical protein